MSNKRKETEIMKKKLLIISALLLVSSAILMSSCSGKGDKLKFTDEGFKSIVAAAFDKEPDKLTSDDLAKVVGIDVYYYAERVGNTNEFKDQWSVTICKDGYHAAYDAYYSASEEECEGLTPPYEFTHNDKLDIFTGYEDFKYFANVRDMSLTSEYTVLKINPIAFITHMKSLEELAVYNYVISDLQPISLFKNMKNLSIGVNLRQLAEGDKIEYIEDITPLKSLERLESLSLSGTSVSDLSPLATLKNLKSLSCTMSSLSDISSVSGIKSLEEVNFYFNGISDVTPLTKLPKLRTICLDYNYITDISPFSKLDANTVEYVTLDMNSIEDLTPLKHLGKDKIYVGYDIYWDE